MKKKNISEIALRDHSSYRKTLATRSEFVFLKFILSTPLVECFFFFLYCLFCEWEEGLRLRLYFIKSVKKWLWRCLIHWLFLKSSLMICHMRTLYVWLRYTTEAYIRRNGHRDYDHWNKHVQKIKLLVNKNTQIKWVWSTWNIS